MRARTRALSGIVVLVVCGLAVAGCTGGSSGASAGAAGVAVGKVPAVAPDDGQAQGPGEKAAVPSPIIAGRQVVRSATIGIRVAHLSDAERTVRQIVAAAHGYASHEDDASRQASFTLQVPQAGLDGVLDQLAKLGRQTSRTEQAQDVTDELVDVRSRLATQRASVDRVRALMNRATSISDVESVEGELTKREADLESLERQQAELSDQVAMSSLTVLLSQVTAPPSAAPAGPGGFVGGLDTGWHAFLGVLAVLLVVLGAVLPFAAVFGGLGAAVWWWLRRRRHPATPAVAGDE
ncbi:MAG TPA: DUF4349 domain-containing protein [Pseudonocardiaceae bacterium]|nr:DUF4349 domain-containing protein [Pseudonocardiaceae bacterium]